LYVDIFNFSSHAHARSVPGLAGLCGVRPCVRWRSRGLVLKLKGHFDHAHYIVQFGTFLYILSEQLRAGPRGDRLDRLGVMRVERICVL